jgi:hypothetical protein
MAILMKEKNKAAKKAKMDKEDLKDKGVDEDKEDKNGKMIKSSLASTEVSQTLSATEVVDEVLDNSNIERNSIPNSTTTAEVSLREKYSKAFGLEEFDIK